MSREFDMTLQRLVSRTLRGGVLLSGAALLAGFALMVVQETRGIAPRTAALSDPGALLTLHVRELPGEPLFWIYVGLLCLLLTPVIRVVLAIVVFAVEKDWRYTVISFVVLTVIAVSALLSITVQ